MGGNKPDGSDQRDPNNMFDNDLNTFWHAFTPVSDYNRITVDFLKPITFFKLVWTSRGFDGTYQTVCLHLNDMDTGECTADDLYTGANEVITMDGGVYEKVNKVALVHTQKNYPAEIAEFEIHYQSKFAAFHFSTFKYG